MEAKSISIQWGMSESFQRTSRPSFGDGLLYSLQRITQTWLNGFLFWCQYKLNCDLLFLFSKTEKENNILWKRPKIIPETSYQFSLPVMPQYSKNSIMNLYCTLYILVIKTGNWYQNINVMEDKKQEQTINCWARPNKLAM